MMLRTGRERLIQTLIFEAVGMAVAVPLYHAAFGGSERNAFALLAVITLAVMIWTPLHNMLFDRIEQHFTGRLASERPHHLRLLHAISHELTPIPVTLPLIMLIGQHSLVEALVVDAGLTVFYIGYAYVFYFAYDWLRPMRRVAMA